MKQLSLSLFFVLFFSPLAAQITEYPLIGAQVFIEPGQSVQDIDQYFRILHENDMDVARIRLFGSHVYKDNVWDFSLYDAAMDAAEKYGIRLFVTLFPVTDELNDVGGFKFPRSKAHLAQVAEYIRAVVTHFGKKSALYCWVLQNEPGTGGTSVSRNDLSDEIRALWTATYETYKRGDGYLRANFDEEKFLKYYTAWYLRWIAQEVSKYDTRHYMHVNPHDLLNNLPEYDFPAFEEFLTSLGISMHMSWHFGYFRPEQYSMGVSLMTDIIRQRAGANPFWVTELQGGSVTASGYVPLCPSAKQVTQWLWTSIASGSQGVIFWTLNQRHGVMEAGEWGLINYLREPSDRLRAAAKVAREVKDFKDFFVTAQPVSSPIAILYNDESIAIQRRNSEIVIDKHHEGRKRSAVIKSVIAAYEAISATGVAPYLSDMEDFDWNPVLHPVAVIPHIIAFPRYCNAKIEDYVLRGGRLIVTGLSGYYDEGMECLFMNRHPLASCLGGDLTEFKVVEDYFAFPLYGLTAHLWQGEVKPRTASVLAKMNDKVLATRNSYGKGEVIWAPSPIGLGSYQRDMKPLIQFYQSLCKKEIALYPVRFDRAIEGVSMRLMKSSKNYLAVIINNSPSVQTFSIVISGKSPKSVTIGKEDTKVMVIDANPE